MTASLAKPTPEQLSTFEPLSSLGPERLRELCGLSSVTRVPRQADPFSQPGLQRGAMFLLRGELLLMINGGGSRVLVGGDAEARHAVNRRGAQVARAKAITEVDLLSIDDDVLDIVVTWDQVAAGEATAAPKGAARADWKQMTGRLSLASLQHGVFAQLPAARIEALLAHFERVPVKRGEVVIREGDEGDYYYVVASGLLEVERLVGGARMLLAELKGGDAFGEEALVSEARRNATVTAVRDGELLRLGKAHFTELLREPLLARVSMEDASRRVQEGAVWLDVRYPSEYQVDRLPGAINVPLNEVRNMFPALDRAKEYVVYCQSGRRSSAAAFLFAQRGFRVQLLEGGLWGAGARPAPRP